MGARAARPRARLPRPRGLRAARDHHPHVGAGGRQKCRGQRRGQGVGGGRRGDDRWRRPVRARASGARRSRSDPACRRCAGCHAAGRGHHRVKRPDRCCRDPDRRLRADADCRSAHRSRRRRPRRLARAGRGRATGRRRGARSRVRQPSCRSGRGGRSVHRRVLLRSRSRGPSAFRGSRVAAVDDERMVFRGGAADSA